MSYVAPAGTPLTLAEISRGLVSGWKNPEAEAELSQELCRVSGSTRAWPIVSGRAAMTLALRAMARCADAGRNQVIIPAYTCFSVAAAVERAGLIPVPCDVDPRTLSLDLDHLGRLQCNAVLAVITANLFGIPNELAEIERLARERGIFLLDDAAQALGARLAGRPVGGFGDLGLYSFDKGKNISTIQGGALLARAGPMINLLEEECRSLPSYGVIETATTIAKLLPYSLLLRPSRYGYVRRLPMLGLGETRYEIRYPITRLNRGLAGLAVDQLTRIAGYQRARVANAEELRRTLDGVPGLRFIELPERAEPAYPRYPVRAVSRTLRDQLLVALDRAGIGATRFYPEALVDVPSVAQRMPPTSQSFAGAREVAATILTLPTHAYSPANLARRIRKVIDTT